MPVVGMVIKTIDAEKRAEVEGGVRVNNSTNLKDVREQDMPAIGKKGLAIGFEFKAGYETDKSKTIAEIIIGGEVYWVADDIDKLLKGWKKDKKLPDEVNLQVINTILRRCLTKSLTLSEDLNLPPPIALPFAQMKQPGEDQSRYIG